MDGLFSLEIDSQGSYLEIKEENLKPYFPFEWATLCEKSPTFMPCGQRTSVAEGPVGFL